MTATAATPPAGGAPRLFVRNTSGLIRTIGVFGALIFGVHCISLSSSGILTFYSVPGLWPGANILIVLTLAGILCAMHAYNFSQIGAAAPRAGADYTLASRTLSPWLAFPASFALVLFSGLVAGSLIAWIPTVALPALLNASGVLYDAKWATDLATFSGSQAGILVFGTIGVLITLVTLFYPTRTVVKMMTIGFVLGLIAWAVILFSFATGSASSFQAAWNHYVPALPYDKVISTAQADGMVLDHSFGNTAIAGLIMGFWIFYGYYIPTFFAGEVKQAETTLLAGSWSSLLVTWAIFVVAALLLQRLVPMEWIAAESYLSNAGISDANPMPWITFYAAILNPNIILLWIVAIAWVYTLINLAQTYFFYCSRIIFAWSFDRLIPEKVCYIHPTLHSPIVAILIITIIAVIGVIDTSGLLWPGRLMGAQLNFVFFAVCTQLIPVLAITIFPFTKPDLFENSSAFVKRKLGGIPVITIVGAITDRK